MIGEKGASFLVLLIVISISVAGVVAGALTCLVRRRRWGPKTALIDAAIAGVVAIVLFFLATVVEGVIGVYESLPTPVLVVAVVSVVIRHLIPPLTTGRKPPTS
jgi:di/tricarboxylate transporter